MLELSNELMFNNRVIEPADSSILEQQFRGFILFLKWREFEGQNFRLSNIGRELNYPVYRALREGYVQNNHGLLSLTDEGQKLWREMIS